jgi:hypothetical protein
MKKNKTGTYNCTNPGLIDHNQILTKYRNLIDQNFTWENFTKEEQSSILKSDRSNNLLDTTLIESEYPEILKIKLNLGDIVILSGQKNSIENNKYYYINNRILATSFIIKNDYNIENGKLYINNKNKKYDFINQNDKIYLPNDDLMCIVILKENEVIICHIIKKLDLTYNYECVTNPNIKFKEQCESLYSISGILKDSYDVWDRKCIYHTDCPFFNLEKNNKYNGKCNNTGYCEMPIGVSSIGYRKYTIENNGNNGNCPVKDKNTNVCLYNS